MKNKMKQKGAEYGIIYWSLFTFATISSILVRVMNKAIEFSSCRNPCLHIFVPNDVM